MVFTEGHIHEADDHENTARVSEIKIERSSDLLFSPAKWIITTHEMPIKADYGLNIVINYVLKQPDGQVLITTLVVQDLQDSLTYICQGRLPVIAEPI